MILQKMISIVGTVFTSEYASVVLYPIFCLAFLASIPSVIRHFCFRR